MTNKLQMRLELYAQAESDGQIQVGPIKFHFQPQEDCMREFYITNTATNEFLGSDLSSMMFKRHCCDQDIEQAYISLGLEETA
jgi:hypothetical protein